MDAIIVANAVGYATPAQDTRGVRSKQQAWDKFMNALDWDKASEKTQGDNPNVMIGALLGTKKVKVMEKGDD